MYLATHEACLTSEVAQGSVLGLYGPGAEHHLPVFCCLVNAMQCNANRRGRERGSKPSVGQSVGQRATACFLRLLLFLEGQLLRHETALPLH